MEDDDIIGKRRHLRGSGIAVLPGVSLRTALPQRLHRFVSNLTMFPPSAHDCP